MTKEYVWLMAYSHALSGTIPIGTNLGWNQQWINDSAAVHADIAIEQYEHRFGKLETLHQSTKNFDDMMKEIHNGE